MNNERDENGAFVRTRKSWTPERWDDGYIDNKGKFRVYRPDYPKAYGGGYALRSHVVWWIHTGRCVPTNHVLHHKNGVKCDDRIDNLKLLEHGAHSSLHNEKRGILFECQCCGKMFRVPRWRVRQRQKEGASRPKYCSQECYNSVPRTVEHCNKISLGLRAYHGS